MISRRKFLKTAALAPLGARPGALRLAPSPNRVRFLDVAASANIHFRHDNAASPEKYLIETMGAGCGWIDYDQNGLLDLYLVNSAATRLYSPRHVIRGALGMRANDRLKKSVRARKEFGCRKRLHRVPGNSLQRDLADLPVRLAVLSRNFWDRG